ncbi:transcriptional activator protein acu-15 [Favolaschia claudopus]|uniref:Transcriptional activator protein acu-15 n=1 Tax=Favolaschia claudopus TaxID=2862362 RepID=A0AAW0DPW1_9AGAR
MPKAQNLDFFAGEARRKALPRGKACATCRCKCDGERPCKQCRRSADTYDCQDPTQTKASNVKPVQGVTQSQHRPQLYLDVSLDQERGGHFGGPGHGSRLVEAWPIKEESSTPTAQSLTLSPSPSSNSSNIRLEQLPPEFLDTLINAVSHNLPHIGFFLDISPFLLPLPFHSHDRPLPILLSALCMWGCRFTQSQSAPHPIYNESAFLLYTLHNIPSSLSPDNNHPQRVLHGIQTHILLSLYFLAQGRSVEGIFHSNAAVDFALDAELHLIQSLPLPERKFNHEAVVERIDAFWTVVLVNNYSVAAFGAPSAIEFLNMPIDTPWPVDVDLVGVCSGREITGAIAGATVSKFLTGLIVDGFSPLALQAKASILLECVISLAAQNGVEDERGENISLDSLEVLLDQFMLSLPLAGSGPALKADPGDDAKESRLLVTQTLTNVAIIRLHAPRINTHPESRTKYMTAAMSVIHIMTTTDLARHAGDPILGVLWATVGQVFVTELGSMDSSIGGGDAAGRYLTEQYQDLTYCLETTLTAMRSCSSDNPFIEQLCVRLEEAYASTLLQN